MKLKHYNFALATLFILAFNFSALSQNIDVDSLLVEALKDVRENKLESGLKKSQLGIKLTPDYLDFHLLAGRIHQLNKQNDSAKYYYNHVIAKNPVYEDAFLYLINLHLEEKNYSEAEFLVDKAIAIHPQKKYFKLKKWNVLQLKNDEKAELLYLKTIEPEFPNDEEIKQRIFFLDSKINSDRIGVNYSYTTFDRDNYGPWHLGSVQYIRERSWGSLIGRINYADRFAFDESIANGLQYEAESYIFTGKMSYSYIGAAYSDDLVFPKLRLGYSYFQNFKKGWEADLGFRFTKADNREFKTGVIGIGKYLGAYWINFRTFIQNEKSDFYPAFTLTTRYYFDTRFDYLTVIAGYGTSPDERTTLGQFDQRVALDSYRMGGGYYRIFNNHYVTGIQATFNNQEYTPGLKQNELELSLMFQYKF
ncbi:YaiO family outer membrane beta-barrel protein [Flavobacterium soli]|uniref:YaiO family outer membrane beta-barrel protein n=1 Tax=Flavobacterium soli TaxID=344881 RepID=UPI00041E1E39|nr:YaiO family outer membrane beta-barrel protein [Flavobacterium soli]